MSSDTPSSNAALLKELEQLRRRNEELEQQLRQRTPSCTPPTTPDSIMPGVDSWMRDVWIRTFDALPDLIALMDGEQRLLRINRALAELLGCDTEQVTGEHCYQVVHGLDQPPEFCPLLRILEHGHSEPVEVYEQHLGGYFVVSNTPVYDDAGRLIGNVHVAQNVTGRRLAQNQLHERLRLQQLIMDISMAFLNAPSERLDATIEQALGQIGEFLDTDRAYLFSYDHEAGHMEQLHRWSKPGIDPTPFNHQTRLALNTVLPLVRLHRDRRPCWIEDSAAMPETDPLRTLLDAQGICAFAAFPLLDPGGCHGFIAFDTLERSRAWSRTETDLLTLLAELLTNAFRRRHREEDLRRAREQAERATLAKSAFLANVSHEIRTPLNAIIGMTALLLDSRLDAHQRHSMEIVRSSGESLLSLINDLLDLSRIEAGKLNLDEIAFDPHQLIQEVVDMLEVRAGHKDLTLTHSLAADVPHALSGDAPRLRQILVNLLGNAIKFTDQGEVRILIERTHQDDQRLGLRFEVIDTGIGIAHEAQARIFEAFNQVEDPHSRQHGGTGLGLAISRQLVELMHGRIGVESQPEQGSRFWFTAEFGLAATLPASTLASQQHPPPGSPQPALKARLLLVEDNLTNQIVARGLLNKLGYADVELASDGREALAALAQHRYDLVLMDCQMPGMDGFEATRRIRRGESAVLDPEVPIIAMTALAMRGDREKCLDAGMTGYIAKPMQPGELAAVLTRHLNTTDVPADIPPDDPGAVECAANLGQDPVFVEQGLLERLMNDRELACSIIPQFLTDLPTRIEELGHCLETRNLEQVSFKAHSIKGLAANISAPRLEKLAATLEAQARDADLQTTEALASRLREEFASLQTVLEHWMRV